MKKIFIFCLFIFFSNFVFCKETVSENIVNSLSEEEFLHASLVASGTDESKISEYEKIISDAVSEFILTKDSFLSEKDFCENALIFLYERFLKKYSLLQTRIDVIVEAGTYNCVSSSVLYMYVMKKAGIECYGNETTEHAFCSVFLDGKKIDVEPTNPYGFEPGKKKQIDDDRYLKVPAKKYSNRKQISDKRLIALIYNNRIADLAKKRNSIDALPLAVAAYELQDNSEESLNFVYKTGANIIAEYIFAGDVDNALDFAQSFVSKYGSSKDIRQNISGGVSRKLELLEKEKDYDSAFAFLNKYSSYLNEKDYSDYERMLNYNSLNYSIKNDSFETASEKIKAKKDFLSEKDFTSLYVSCATKELNRISVEEDYYEAYLFAWKVSSEFPKMQGITKLYEISKENYAIQVHNSCVDLMNSGNNEEAKKLIINAILEIGSVKILENDLKYLK